MTEIYFVRHAQPISPWPEDDRTRPLTESGSKDSALVTIALRDIKFDYCACSTYIRSINTIKECAESHHLEIHTDPRFRERTRGKNNTRESMYQRWADRDFHEEGGECINSVQKRNIEGLMELLKNHKDETILFGTHGCALSSIIDYFNPGSGQECFIRLYRWLPYVTHITFDGDKLVAMEDILILNKGY